AGNDAFRQGQWEQGVGAIFRAAAAAVPARGAGGVDAPVGAAQARPSLIGPGTILLIVGGIVALGIFLARRRSTDGYSGYAGPGPNYGGPPYGAGGYPGYGPGGGGGGMGPLGGGLIGAGLGGLAGYELGKAAGEREERERDGAGGPGDSSASVGGEDSFDAGGGGSSWDDGGGGFDGGGGDGGSGGGSDF
ncbi:MAG TPA: hypothetical protein VKU41_10680, partial [Polyangiaceae bacterium]|nr:hypothetical protein [Polyangiaceae bacterium]